MKPYSKFKFHITSLGMSFIVFLFCCFQFPLPLPNLSIIFYVRLLRERKLQQTNISKTMPKMSNIYIVSTIHKGYRLNINSRKEAQMRASYKLEVYFNTITSTNLTHIFTINQVCKRTSTRPYSLNNAKNYFVNSPFGIAKRVQGLKDIKPPQKQYQHT